MEKRHAPEILISSDEEINRFLNTLDPMITAADMLRSVSAPEKYDMQFIKDMDALMAERVR